MFKVYGFLLLLTMVSCKPQTNEIVGEWVGISTSKGSGTIFNFKSNSKLIIGGVIRDTTTEVNYKYDQINRKLILEYHGQSDTMKAEITTTGHLAILRADSSLLEFVRTRNVDLKVTKAELIQQLRNSSWTYSDDGDTIRVDFFSTQRWNNNSQPFEAMFHWLSSHKKVKEIWNIGEYNGKLFLLYTNHQFDEFTHQIIEFEPNRMMLVSNTSNDLNKFLVFERTKDQSKSPQSLLTSRSWISLKKDTIFTGEMGWGVREGVDEISISRFFETLKFSFNLDSTYSISISDKEWMKGKWKMTRDNRYIAIDDERYSENWIQLNQVGQNLVLEKLQKIKDSDDGYKMYMVKMKLE